MCLIFTNKLGQSFNTQAMENAYISNPDGLGILIYNGDAWHVERHVDVNLDRILDKLETADSFAIHFRYATHGKVSVSNCHPFSLGDGWFLMHNGILPFKPTRAKRSDTWQFCQYLRNMGVTQFSDSQFNAFLPIMSESIGSDKLLIAKPDGTIIRLGHWVDRPEGYYSNSGCLYNRKNALHIPKGRSTLNDIIQWDKDTPSWAFEDGYVTGNRYVWDEELGEFK